MLTPTQLDLDDLRVIHAVVRQNGATRAARVLGLSQSAVSHRLRLVEERLGFPLFERRGKSLVPLPAALRFAGVAESVVAPLAALEAELEQGSLLPPLRIATQCFTGYGWLPAVLRRVSQAHPDLQVEVVPEATSDPVAALVAGELDLAIAGEPPRGKRFVAERLFDDELVVVTPPEHRLAKRRWVDAPALSEEPLFLFELSASRREYFRQRLFPQGGGFRRVHRVPLTEAIVALVRAGAGLSILPRWSVEEPAARNEIAVVRLTRSGLWRHWHGVYSRQSPHREVLEELVQLLRGAGPRGCSKSTT